MKILLLTFEAISSILLIISVLLHSAKGEGLGSIGGSAKLFRTQKGMEAGLDKITTTLTIIFMASAALLYFIS